MHKMGGLWYNIVTIYMYMNEFSWSVKTPYIIYRKTLFIAKLSPVWEKLINQKSEKWNLLILKLTNKKRILINGGWLHSVVTPNILIDIVLSYLGWNRRAPFWSTSVYIWEDQLEFTYEHSEVHISPFYI